MATQTIQYNIDLNTGNSLKTLGDVEKELEKINKELKEVEVGSDRFDELSKKAQVLNKDFEKINNSIEGITGEDKIQALDGSLKVLGGTVQGVVGGLGLLGIESESFGKFEEKAASAIALGIGIKDVGEGIGQLSKVTGKLPAVMKKAAAAQKAFNLVVRANPIGAIVTAITLVIAGFLLFSGKITETIKKIEPLNKILQKTVGFFKMLGRALGLVATEEEEAAEKFKKSTDSRIADIDREVALRKAKGEETVELEREKLQKLIQLTEEGTEEQKTALNNLAVFEAGLLKKKQDDINKATKEAADKRKEAQDKIDADQKVIDDAETARLKKIDDDKKKRKDDAKALGEEEKLEAELLGLTEFEAEQEKLDREYEIKLAKLKEFKEDSKALDENYLAATEAINARKLKSEEETTKAAAELAKQEADIKRSYQMSTIDNYQAALTSLFGESKAIASANVVVDAGQAAVGILNQSFKNINPATALAFQVSQFALLAVTTAASLKQINSAKPGAKSFTAPTPGGGGGFSSQAPTSATASSQAETQLDITEASSRGQQPIRSYVLVGDVNSAQEAAARINQRRVVGRN